MNRPHWCPYIGHVQYIKPHKWFKSEKGKQMTNQNGDWSSGWKFIPQLVTVWVCRKLSYQLNIHQRMVLEASFNRINNTTISTN